jgi:hypothetical protein
LELSLRRVDVSKEAFEKGIVCEKEALLFVVPISPDFSKYEVH